MTVEILFQDEGSLVMIGPGYALRASAKKGAIMLRFYLKDQCFALAGNVRKLTPDTLNSLRAIGGRHTNLHHAHYFIAGTNPGKAAIEARALGLPVFSVDQVIKGAKFGYIDYLEEDEKVIEEDAGMGELIGAARSLLADPALDASSLWTGVMEIVERCESEELPPLLHYLSEAIDRTNVRLDKPWKPSPKHPLLNKVSKKWALGCTKRDVRVAPPAWIFEMTRQEPAYHPKHELVRVLNLDLVGGQDEQLHKIFSNPHLKNIVSLNMGRHVYYTHELLGELDRYPALHHIEELWLYRFDQSLLNALATNLKALRNLRAITFFGCKLRYHDQIHYGDLDEEQGERLIAQIQQLNCFTKPPHIDFLFLGKR